MKLAGPVHVLGLDMGFAELGWSILVLGKIATEDRVLRMGVFVTKPSKKKRGIFTQDDNVFRTAAIWRHINGLVTEHGVRLICAESFVYHRGIKASAKMGLAWGALVSIVEARAVSLLDASPQDVKLVSAGKIDASKAEVSAALVKRFGKRLPPACLTGVTPSLQHHAYDSLASTVACLGAPIVPLLRAA